MLKLLSQVESAAATIRSRWSTFPRVAMILGSGHGEIVREVSTEQAIDYVEIPYFPRATALGHRGRVICGRLAGVPVIVFQGRLHLYEGNTAQQTAFPVRVANALGPDLLITTNAAGGLNPTFSAGDMMAINDQINLTFANPLIGVNDDKLGQRFPDMLRPYDPKLNEVAAAIARIEDFALHHGVYVGVTGPNFETRAEYRMLRRLGGDVVGMSTVSEVVAARHAGMRVVGFSTITNVGSPDVPKMTSASAVLATAARSAERLAKIIHGIVATSK